MGVSLSLSITENGQNIASNSTNVTVALVLRWSGGSYNNNKKYGELIIDGSAYGFNVNFNWNGASSSGSVTVLEKTVDIYHNVDGTKTLECSAFYESGVSSGTVYASASKSLTPIPQGSGLSISGSVLGSQMTIAIDSASSSFAHTLTYKCGSASGTILSKSSSKSVNWTPPLTLAQQNTSGTGVPITFTLVTYSGNTALSTETTELICSIPDSVKPTVSISVTEGTGHYSKYGGYVQGQSVLSVKLTTAGAQGSTVESCSTAFDGRTYTGASFTVEKIKGSGSLTMTATVKDSRGRTGSASVTLNVLAYELPKISSMTAIRCNADGTLNSSGAYLKVIFDAAISSLSSKNTASYALKYKKSTDSSYTTVTLSGYAGKFSVSGGSYIFAAVTTTSYDITITATDNFGSTPKSIVGSSVKKLWSAMAKGVGFAFGKVAEKAGYLDMGFHIHMNGNRVHGLPTPTASDEAVTLGMLNEQIQSLTTTLNTAIDGMQAKLDAKVSLDVLWENAAYNGTFAAQEIVIDLTDYNAILIETAGYGSFLLGKDNYCQMMYNVIYEDYNYLYAASRGVSCDSEGVYFNDCFNTRVGSGILKETANNLIVPGRILGIKGVPYWE